MPNSKILKVLIEGIEFSKRPHKMEQANISTNLSEGYCQMELINPDALAQYLKDHINDAD